jgi:hypothetical protein
MRSSSRYLPRTVPAATGMLPVDVDVVRMLAVTGTKLSRGRKRRTMFGRSDLAGVKMRRSLADAAARQQLVARLGRLRPEARPIWGRMTAPRMLAHLTDWMLMASGDLLVADKKAVLRYPPIKQIVIYWLPFPKGVPTAPELLARKPAEWELERATLCERIESFETLFRKPQWPDHPVFGPMTPHSWSVLGYRHTDHHLRQFGV